MPTKRPSKKIQVKNPTPIRKSPLGKSDADAHAAIAAGKQPGRGYRIDGQ